jgi:hypothetical protein
MLYTFFRSSLRVAAAILKFVVAVIVYLGKFGLNSKRFKR